jgi:hypothetical protein
MSVFAAGLQGAVTPRDKVRRSVPSDPRHFGRGHDPAGCEALYRGRARRMRWTLHRYMRPKVAANQGVDRMLQSTTESRHPRHGRTASRILHVRIQRSPGAGTFGSSWPKVEAGAIDALHGQR